MANNPILDELHAVRERLLADAGGTLDALVDCLQAKEIVLASNPDEQTVAPERRSRANYQLRINRRRPVNGDVLPTIHT